MARPPALATCAPKDPEPPWPASSSWLFPKSLAPSGLLQRPSSARPQQACLPRQPFRLQNPAGKRFPRGAGPGRGGKAKYCRVVSLVLAGGPVARPGLAPLSLFCGLLSSLALSPRAQSPPCKGQNEYED